MSLTKSVRACFLVLSVTASRLAFPDVVLRDDFERQQDGWRKNVRGDATVELVSGGISGKCLKTTAQGGLAYYSRTLDLRAVRGRKIVARCRVKLDNVKVGPQVYSTAKLHVAVRVDGRIRNYATRFVGTTEWQERVLKADVPTEAEVVHLDLGTQNGTGAAYFDSLVIDDSRRPLMPISILPAANTSCTDGVANDGAGGFIDLGGNDLRELPTGEVTFAGIPFNIPHPGANWGQTCVVLRGKRRPKLPVKTIAPIPVGESGRQIIFLHACAWLDKNAAAPCLTYLISFSDGRTVKAPMVEGQDLIQFDAPEDVPNCRVVWRGKDAMGRPVGLGAFRWQNPRPKVPIKSISAVSSGSGAVPIVVAITLDRRGEDKH